jgi:hypothetical protein
MDGTWLGALWGAGGSPLIARGPVATVLAEPVQLDPVRVEDEARLRSHLVGDDVQPQVADFGSAPAIGAHHVVVMTGLTDDVGMGAVWQVDPLDEAELLEDLEGPEHGRSSYTQPPALRLADQLEGREVLVTIGEQLGDGTTRGGHEMTGSIEGLGPGLRVSHGENDTQSLSSRRARAAERRSAPSSAVRLAVHR